MTIETLALLFLGVIIITLLIMLHRAMRDNFIQRFKIGYYEQKLKNRDVDISAVENITLEGIRDL